MSNSDTDSIFLSEASDQQQDKAASVEIEANQQEAEPAAKEPQQEEKKHDADPLLPAPISTSASPSSSSPILTLGPCIGLVETNTARVLIEVNSDSTISCTATPIPDSDPSATPITVSTAFTANIPSVFQFTGLTPSTRYTLTFSSHLSLTPPNPSTPSVFGSFKTFSPTQHKLKAIAAACDKTSNRGPVDLFDRIYQEHIVKEELELFIRHGDQVYADEAFKQARALLIANEKKGEKDELVLPEMVQLYSQIYRQTFTNRSVRRVLANVSTLTIMDDHELCNDFGTWPSSRDPLSIEYRTCKAARRAYHLYQRQLWEEIQGKSEAELENEWHFHRFGSCGVLFVDFRGARTFNYQVGDLRNFMGTTQYVACANALGLSVAGEEEYKGRAGHEKSGIFKDCTTLILVESMPLVHLSSTRSNCLSACFDAQRDKMGFGMYPEEQREWLRTLEAWQENGTLKKAEEKTDKSGPAVSPDPAAATPDVEPDVEGVTSHSSSSSSSSSSTPGPKRKLIVLGGDLHFSARTIIRNNGRPVFEQFICSAISNSPPPALVYYCLDRLCLLSCWCFAHTIRDSEYEVEHFDHLPTRNYLAIEMDGTEKERPKIMASFVGADKGRCNTRCI